MPDPAVTDDTDKPGTAAAWLSAIKRAQAADGMTAWNARCERIRKRYRYEGSTEARQRRYQLLWSNMETMKPAVYTKTPQAAVIRRFRDKDPTARVASDMLERCINYTLDANDYNAQFEQVRDDFLLFARGVARLYYEPVMQPDPAFTGTNGLDAQAVEGDAEAAREIEAQPGEIVAFEHVKIAYVQREDFVHAPARVWGEVPWVSFRSYLTRDELRARFDGKTEDGQCVADLVSLDASPELSDRNRTATEVGNDRKATIWEIWDRAGDRVLWVSPGYPDTIEEGEPYLRMQGFFPCPRPAYGTLTNDTLEPVPDYVYYQDQCEEIDMLTARIGALTEQLKIVGFYSSGNGDATAAIEQAAKPGVENKLIAIPNWAQFKEGGGASGAIEWWPVDLVGKVLEGCVKMRQQLIDDVYQIYGLSDIMRGDGNASETATAQSIKAQFGSVRIRGRQQELARFCRDICQMIGEIMCEHFQPGTLMAMSNMPLPSAAELAEQQIMAQRQALLAQIAQNRPVGPIGALGGAMPPGGALPQPQAAPGPVAGPLPA